MVAFFVFSCYTIINYEKNYNNNKLYLTVQNCTNILKVSEKVDYEKGI